MREAGVRILIIFLGLLCFPEMHAEPTVVTLSQAVRRAISEEGNPKARLSREFAREAEAGSRLARSPLLPQLTGSVGKTRQTRNLEALGLESTGPFQIPRLVGPFNTFDARLQLRQVLFDFSSIRRFQASRRGVEAARLSREETLDAVAAAVGAAYAEALRKESSLASAEANVRLAEELLDLAFSQKRAGTGTQIEVVRAEVQLARRKQSEMEAREAYRTALLRLKRWIGMPLGREIGVVDPNLKPPSGVVVAQAVDLARRERKDLQAQKKRIEQTRLLEGAEKWERLPDLVGFADYGTIGPCIGEAIPTWAVGVSLEIPIFEGGALEARRAQAASRLRQEEVRLADLTAEVELEVRTAIEKLELAGKSLEVALESIRLAEEELERARRRYRAGVTTSLEVTDAQTRFEEAQSLEIEARHAVTLASIQLADAQGVLRSRLVN